MLASLTNVPPALALLAAAGVFMVVAAGRIIVTCWLGLAAIRTARSRDLAEVLRAVKEVVDTAVRWRR